MTKEERPRSVCIYNVRFITENSMKPQRSASSRYHSFPLLCWQHNQQDGKTELRGATETLTPQKVESLVPAFISWHDDMFAIPISLTWMTG